MTLGGGPVLSVSRATFEVEATGGPAGGPDVLVILLGVAVWLGAFVVIMRAAKDGADRASLRITPLGYAVALVAVAAAAGAIAAVVASLLDALMP